MNKVSCSSELTFLCSEPLADTDKFNILLSVRYKISALAVFQNPPTEQVGNLPELNFTLTIHT
jgi:hypothetical protein